MGTGVPPLNCAPKDPSATVPFCVPSNAHRVKPRRYKDWQVVPIAPWARLEPAASATLVKGILERLNQETRAVPLVLQANSSILKKRTALWNKSADLLRQFNLRGMMALDD